MADTPVLSKIRLNGTEYELKDAVAREGLENKADKDLIEEVYLITFSGDLTVTDDSFPIPLTCNRTPEEIISALKNNSKKLEAELINTGRTPAAKMPGGFFNCVLDFMSTSVMMFTIYYANNAFSFYKIHITYTTANGWRATKRTTVLASIDL